MVRRTLAALLALLAATACTGGGDGLATPEATPTPPAATAATPTPPAEPTAAATATAAVPPPAATATASPTPAATPTPDPTATAEPTLTATATATASPPPDPPATPVPRTTFDDGEWRVGVDIAPGRYLVWAESAGCGWSTDSGKKGAARRATGAIVEIAASDRTFLSWGCGEWTAHPRPDVTSGQPFGDGDYLVGVDIAPGRYRMTTASDRCYWRIGALVHIHPQRGDRPGEQGGRSIATIIDIRPSDRIFSTLRCGTWTTDLTPRTAPGEPFGDGTWLVGSEIAPGRYYTTSETCTWRRWPSNFVSTFGRIGPDISLSGNVIWGAGAAEAKAGIALGQVGIRGADVVDIDPTDVGFSSEGCEWTTNPAPRIGPGEPFGDGTWFVGPEVAPGLYVASKPANPGSLDIWEMCRWAHLGDFRGRYRLSRSASLAAIVDIDPADTGFYSARCGEWTPYRGPAVVPGQPFGDGVFLVGAEIAHGPYQAPAPSEGCRWERLREDGDSGYRGDYGGGAHQIANVAPDDVGFASRGCGMWERVPIASFGDGEYRVGVDIPPGRYRAAAPTEECAWERRDADGVTGFGGSSIPVAEVILDLARLDRHPVFASSGCGTWTNDPTPRITPGQPFGDGAWLIGSEVAPGRYRATDPSNSCRWARLRGFRDRYDGEYDEKSGWGGSGPNLAGSGVTRVVDLPARDAAFLSHGCGTWTRDLQPIAKHGEPFGDGTYIVGLDIAPGRYRAYPASAPDESLASCRWERLGDFDGARSYTYGRLPSADGGGSEGMAVLTVDIHEPDEGFHSKNCGTWTAELTPAATPGQPFGDGEWIVGLDIAPGRYRAHSPSDSCRWSRLRGFGGHSFLLHETDSWGRIEAIERWYDLDDPGEVTIAHYDAGFASRGCGTWTPASP